MHLIFSSIFRSLFTATEESEIATPRKLDSEAFWPQSDITPSLSQVALTKPNANFALLELHLQLANVLHMCAYFDVKITNILTTLFDSAGKAALFIDLCSQPRLPSHNPDQKLINSRTQFLCKVISASMQTIHVIEAGELIDGEISGPKLDASGAAEWMKSCLILANSWGVNSDVLRRHQICELYMNGHDRLAEEIISSVSDEILLGSQLLLIAGQRLLLAVLYSKDVAEKLSTLGTAASNWLKSVEVGNQCCGSSLADSLQLLTNISRLIPSDHKDNWLIQQLLDSCQHFSNVDQN